MKEMNIDILGAIYSVQFGSRKDYPLLEECDGFTDTSSGLIVIYDMKDIEDDTDRKRNLESYQNTVARHEVLHAFLYESGLANNSFFNGAWATNEEMIDWFAIQYPKIKATYKKLDIE